MHVVIFQDDGLDSKLRYVSNKAPAHDEKLNPAHDEELSPAHDEMFEGCPPRTRHWSVIDRSENKAAGTGCRKTMCVGPRASSSIHYASQVR